MPRFIHHNSFNWQSDLSDERKDQIITWIASLNEDQQKMLEEMFEEVLMDEHDSNNPDL